MRRDESTWRKRDIGSGDGKGKKFGKSEHAHTDTKAMDKGKSLEGVRLALARRVGCGRVWTAFTGP